MKSQEKRQSQKQNKSKCLFPSSLRLSVAKAVVRTVESVHNVSYKKRVTEFYHVRSLSSRGAKGFCGSIVHCPDSLPQAA